MPEYRTPGVYIEEISGGPRPVAPSSTTDTGFIAVLTLPSSFIAGTGLASGMYLPAAEEQALLAWNRARAFRALADGGAAAADPKAKGKGAKPAAKGGNRFESLVGEILPGKWTVKAPNGENAITMTNDKSDILRFPVSKTLMSVKESGAAKEWEMAWGADEQKVLELIAGNALGVDVSHSGSLPCADSAKSASIDLDKLHEIIIQPAPALMGMAAYTGWRLDLSERLFCEIIGQASSVSAAKATAIWDTLPVKAKQGWDRWVRTHPGIHRLELALQGFFENGGATAYPCVVIQAHGAAGPNKRGFLEASYDGVAAVAMLCAPGLDQSWQTAILEYSGPKGRSDLFAVLETPRYLLTKEPRDASLGKFRWTKGGSPYEMGVLETTDSPESKELRFLGFANDELLDRTIPRDDVGHGAAYGPWLIVDNHLSTGPHDRYVICPPGGHVAGVIASTDLRAGGGVHKAPANEQMLGLAELVTEISDREQGPLNTKSINIIRHRPGAGVRIWGARTVAADANWRYVNVRRLFLFVERSVRDAVGWAVFLPNTATTRRDLATTIRSFLYSLWNQGMLDGASHSDAYNVTCDGGNNPDVDIRNGLLTVDVTFRPPYPAEFVRIRFRQAPMDVPD